MAGGQGAEDPVERKKPMLKLDHVTRAVNAGEMNNREGAWRVGTSG